MNDTMSLAMEDWPANAVMGLRTGRWLVWSPEGQVVGDFSSANSAVMFLYEWVEDQFHPAQ